MHKVHYDRTTTFNYKKLPEYPYLYTFTATFNKNDINHLVKFNETITLFENTFKIHAFFKLARCVNNKEGSFHTYQKMLTKHSYHFHGFIASKERIDLTWLHSKNTNNCFYIQECDDDLYYDNFMNYVNEYHAITTVYKGYSF